MRFANKPLFAVRERLRFALIVACAVTIAMIISRILNGPHGFWLPLAVAFILRPDVGPVITRALARTVGTAVGVGIAALVALRATRISNSSSCPASWRRSSPGRSAARTRWRS